jgi:hypothetical protein
MTLGDYRDGSGLSWVPPRRKTYGLGIACASLVIIAGVAGFGWGVWDHQTSNEIRNSGETAMGMLVGYGPIEGGPVNGRYALVDFPISDSTVTGHSVEQVPAGTGLADGTPLTVHYLDGDPEKTFIDGVDQLRPPRLQIFFGSASVFLLGLLMLLRPPGRQVREACARKAQAA